MRRLERASLSPGLYKVGEPGGEFGQTGGGERLGGGDIRREINLRREIGVLGGRERNSAWIQFVVELRSGRKRIMRENDRGRN